MRKKLLLGLCALLMFSITYAQTTATGKVVDDKGAAISGASVQEKGTKNGTTTGADGSYSIKVKSGATLLISSVGYEAVSVAAGSGMKVKLQNISKDIEEVTVTTALGIKRQPRELGYSTTRVSAEDLNLAKVTNIANGLAAKVSGLQVNLVNNGVKPDLRITLRGNRSITGNNQALLVVDDIQLPISYMSTINPNDIESATVLKGASASALYGSDASNGVIILTTKKGKGRPTIKFSTGVTVESIAYMPDFQNEFGQYGGENDPNSYPGIVQIPGSQPDIYYVPYENQSYGPRYNGQKVPIGAPIRVYKADGSYTIQQDYGTYSAVPNAKKNFFNKGTTTQNSLSYSAGDDKSKFLLSFEDVFTKGIIPNDENRRDAIRLSGSRESGKFRADYSLGYTLTHTSTTPGANVPFNWGTSELRGNYTGMGGSYFQNRPLYWTIINTPANIDLQRYKNWRTDPFSTPDGYYNAYYGNPWWQIDQTRLDERNNSLLGNIALAFKANDWLDFQYRASLARTDYTNKYSQAGYTFAKWAIADTLGSGNIPSGVKKLSPSQGDAISSNQRLQSDFVVTAHKSYGEFDVKLLAGTQFVENTVRLQSNSASALVISDFYNISNRLGEATVSQYFEQSRKIGLFVDATVGYKNYLFLHASVRNDKTSLLSQDNRSFNYPAVDMAFVFSDAITSLKSSKVLSFGKVRLAHSKTGNVSVGPYSLQNTFDVGNGFPFGNTAGYSLNGQFANANLKPEFTTENEVGLDLGFLKNRINFSFAYYSASTINQTLPISTSPAIGYTSALVNAGEMTNKGYEIDLKITPVLATKSGFKWDIGMNYSYNKNEVVSSYNDLKDITLANSLSSRTANNNISVSSHAVVGLPFAQIQTTDWKRDDQGRVIIDPLTGYPSLDPNLKLFGTANPTTKVGFNTSFSYKGLSLSAIVDGRFGGYIFNGLGPSLDFTGVSKSSAAFGRQPFVIPNSSYSDGSGKYVANTTYVTKDGNNLFWANVWNTAGSNYITNADFWKLREIALSYSVPKKMVDKLKIIRSLSITIFARNLITIKSKANQWADPEFANTNGNAVGNTDINQLPPTKFFGANLSVTF